ncbi:MAG: hypothetical protein KAX44_09130, partial [Candidatus Brocadiae bacterium]|nr:hypothetical protein [Candidatus Brocadiia bacterium]
YAVYFPDGGEVSLDLGDAEGQLEMRWYGIEAGRWEEPEPVQGGGVLELACPGPGQWAAVLR